MKLYNKCFKMLINRMRLKWRQYWLQFKISINFTEARLISAKQNLQPPKELGEFLKSFILNFKSWYYQGQIWFLSPKTNRI